MAANVQPNRCLNLYFKPTEEDDPSAFEKIDAIIVHVADEQLKYEKKEEQQEVEPSRFSRFINHPLTLAIGGLTIGLLAGYTVKTLMKFELKDEILDAPELTTTRAIAPDPARGIVNDHASLLECATQKLVEIGITNDNRVDVLETGINELNDVLKNAEDNLELVSSAFSDLLAAKRKITDQQDGLTFVEEADALATAWKMYASGSAALEELRKQERSFSAILFDIYNVSTYVGQITKALRNLLGKGFELTKTSKSVISNLDANLNHLFGVIKELTKKKQ